MTRLPALLLAVALLLPTATYADHVPDQEAVVP